VGQIVPILTLKKQKWSQIMSDDIG